MDTLKDPENELSLVKQRLDSLQGLEQEVQGEMEAVKEKYERWTGLIKEHKRVEKDKRGVRKETEQVREVVRKARSSLQTCQEKTREMEEKNSLKAKVLERERIRLDSAPDVWQLLGLRLTVLDSDENGFSNSTNTANGSNSTNTANGSNSTNGSNGSNTTTTTIDQKQRNLSFHFSKIDPGDEKRVFTVKVSHRISKDRTCFKIYESDPLDLFSSPQIDSIENEAGNDSRRLIILLRKHIESKVAGNKPIKEKIHQPTREEREKIPQSTREEKREEKIHQPTREEKREKIHQPTMKEKIPQPTREEKIPQKSGQPKDDGALKENGQPKSCQPKSCQPKSCQSTKEDKGTKIPVSKIPLAR